MTSGKPRFVKDYPIIRYRCGLRAGDNLKVKKDLVVTQGEEGRPTGEVHRRGEIWEVCRGTRGIVWLRQPNGEMATWDDDESIFTDFKKVETITIIPSAKTKRTPQRGKNNANKDRK